MWINRAINRSDEPESLHFAKVTKVNNGAINTLSHIQTINTPIVSPVGITALPWEGQDVFIAPTITGEYVCLGTGMTAGDVSEGELKLFSAGGAYIHLQSNGDIVLNGVTITKDGEIVSPALKGGESK